MTGNIKSKRAKPKKIKLGVNIDHIATIRQARNTPYPSLIKAAKIAIENGADSITIHLREDRRHIQDADLPEIREITPILNLEMAATDEMLAIAIATKPDICCLVPEKREELTTEGGLNLEHNPQQIQKVIHSLQEHNIQVSLFIEPDIKQVKQAKKMNANAIELHTGHYAILSDPQPELEKLKEATHYAITRGLQVNAGHGLHLDNVTPITDIEGIHELNIGQSLISDALFIGLGQAIKNIKIKINA